MSGNFLWGEKGILDTCYGKWGIYIHLDGKGANYRLDMHIIYAGFSDAAGGWKYTPFYDGFAFGGRSGYMHVCM